MWRVVSPQYVVKSEMSAADHPLGVRGGGLFWELLTRRLPQFSTVTRSGNRLHL